MSAAVDCEAIGTGLLAQPVNTVSSLALVAVGALLALSSDRRGDGWRRSAVGGALVAAGIGSIAFHGTTWPSAGWVHDVGVLAVPVAVAVTAGPRPHRRVARDVAVTVLAAAGGVLVVAPGAGNLLAGGAVVVAAAAEAWAWLAGTRPRTGWRLQAWWAAAGTGVVAVAVNVLGRAGGPWCDPDSLVQGHAAWHVLGAVALATWSLAVHDTDRAG